MYTKNRGIVTPATLTSARLLTGLLALLDRKNLSIDVGIALLLCLKAETNIIPHPLPVEGRHIVRFTTHPDV